ncbi:MAG: pyridoxamine 5'-phosphate oxidase family protein [endosymbiont of Seepiophila jonesi]|uniref:Pyridoxamine 5'-phosphate oxidase family protein n=1 Tax=endosymbiont of Lamellibrachia luymesi TaxID=2200907 RepID=A0A370E1F9_9GAMM|nr:MAG: pyridoxamine 5'-phosphate oxidase family protein [endosymbiont of Seepiophila jonesi]RDH93441.1 MAG: pyridoxamine 5'-phosphate oxidase family protein [endosymbiont of Lamellibrachia luymesi]
MGKRYDSINDKLVDFIIRQQIFFVATAAVDGRINLSPKGMDSLRVVSPNQVVWLNLTGSGNETAAHLLESDRMTLMFCAFDADPKILRLYGQAAVHHEGSAEWDAHIGRFPGLPGARQIVVMDVDLAQTSCGFGVPLFEFQGDRDTLKEWANNKGEEGIREYWLKRNSVSLDGKPTGMGGKVKGERLKAKGRQIKDLPVSCVKPDKAL